MKLNFVTEIAGYECELSLCIASRAHINPCYELLTADMCITKDTGTHTHTHTHTHPHFNALLVQKNNNCSVVPGSLGTRLKNLGSGAWE